MMERAMALPIPEDGRGDRGRIVAGIIASTLAAALATSSHGDAAALAEAPPHEGVSP
jgi:hypothetical protein